MLPGDLDGLGLAKTIGKRYPQIPVLLTSGYAKALSGQHGMDPAQALSDFRPSRSSALDARRGP
jgi:hypothetical protein